MRKALLFIIPTTIVLLSAYFIFYDKLLQPKKKPIELVPKSAALVYESDNLLNGWHVVQKKAIWNSLNKLPEVETFRVRVDSLFNRKDQHLFLDLFGNTQTLISLHVTSNNTFDALVLSSLSRNISSRFTEFLEEEQKRGTLAIKSHTYKGMDITDVETKQGFSFSYVKWENILALSTTPFLVEDVVRLIEDPALESFLDANKQIFNLNKLENDDGNIYINYDNFSFWLSSFASPKMREFISSLGNTGDALYQDLKIENEQLILSGFSFYSGSDDFLKVFAGQQADGITLHKYVPNRSGIFADFSYSDREQFKKNISVYINGLDQLKANKQRIKDDYNIDVENFYKWVGNEYALCVMESVKQEKLSKLAIIKYSDLGEALKQLNELAEAVSRTTGDSLYVEEYANLKLNDIEVKELPSAIFGNLFSGFDRFIYTVYDDVILVANELQVLKTVINDLELENTWGKTLRTGTFIEKLGEDANYSLLVNSSRFWNIGLERMDEAWKRYLSQSGESLLSLDLLAFQHLYYDNKFYSSTVVNYNPSRLITRESSTFRDEFITILDTTLATKPFIIKNHDDLSFEVFVQDADARAYQIDRNGDILWRDSLENMIIDAHQIDYFNNKNLQLLAITPTTMQLFDRDGNEVGNFPINLQEYGTVDQFGLVDYDRSKNYRFFLSTNEGSLVLLNKSGYPLDGWNGKRLSGKLATYPRHIRINGKDYMLAIQKEGTVNVFNRRGTYARGFPIELKSVISSNCFIDTGAGIRNSFIHVVTQEGEIVQISLQGQVVTRKQLYKPTAETKFLLIPDALNKSFVIIRRDLGRIAVIDRTGETLFEKDYLDTEEMSFQYYIFDATKQCVVINDPVREYSYLYSLSGELINNRPLDSSFEIALLYFESDNRYYAYHTFGKELRKTSFAW